MQPLQLQLNKTKNVLSKNEEKMIKGISEIFKMPNNLVESIKIQFFEVNKQYNLKDDYKVLLSSPNDTLPAKVAFKVLPNKVNAVLDVLPPLPLLCGTLKCMLASKELLALSDVTSHAVDKENEFHIRYCNFWDNIWNR